MAGLRPVFAVYSTFLQRAYDQVVHDVCHHNLPVLFAVDRAGLVGGDGATHQGIYDIAFLRTVPHMEIAMGKDEAEMRRLIKAALDRPNPVAVRYPRGPGRGIALEQPIESIEWARAEWLHHGRDLTIIAIGPMVYRALEVRDRLDQSGFEVGVLNARFIKPLDEEALKLAVSESSAVMTVEEHALAGGFGSAVAEWMASQSSAVPLRLEALPDVFIDHGPTDYYLDMFELSAEALSRKAVAWLQGLAAVPRS
jgi:1-deoxy-D-xylulose-5-phosphate synthase